MGDLDSDLMALALEQARASLDAGGVPVGAVLAAGREVIGAGHNERVQRGDPVAHGEIACLRNVGRRPSYAGTTLYTTLSPCQMCTGAILLFQIPRVVVGEAGQPALGDKLARCEQRRFQRARQAVPRCGGAGRRPRRDRLPGR
jgi:tRNA(Arg) A34 adenosine deaminase TadA